MYVAHIMYIINKLPFSFYSWLNTVHVLDYLCTPSPLLTPENGEYTVLQKKLQFKKGVLIRTLPTYFIKIMSPEQSSMYSINYAWLRYVVLYIHKALGWTWLFHIYFISYEKLNVLAHIIYVPIKIRFDLSYYNVPKVWVFRCENLCNKLVHVLLR